MYGFEVRIGEAGKNIRDNKMTRESSYKSVGSLDMGVMGCELMQASVCVMIVVSSSYDKVALP